MQRKVFNAVGKECSGETLHCIRVGNQGQLPAPAALRPILNILCNVKPADANVKLMVTRTIVAITPDSIPMPDAYRVSCCPFASTDIALSRPP